MVSAGAVADAALDRVSVHDAHQDRHPHGGADDAGCGADLEDVPVQISESRDHGFEPVLLLGLDVAPIRSLVEAHAADPAHPTVGAAVADGLLGPAPDGHRVARSAARVSSGTKSIARSGTVSGARYAGTP